MPAALRARVMTFLAASGVKQCSSLNLSAIRLFLPLSVGAERLRIAEGEAALAASSLIALTSVAHQEAAQTHRGMAERATSRRRLSA
jgi:hypothetical protein